MLAPLIIDRIEKYGCETTIDYQNALLEIIQEIALFGLWRSKFFEHAAFYGGTALRILYGLNRFSEDLDFSLMKPNPHFSLTPYHHAIERELEALGFNVEIVEKQKKGESTVKSAFIKGNTKEHLIKIGFEGSDKLRVPASSILKIKFEIDVDPPDGFSTEPSSLAFPVPFSVKGYSLPSMFAGKMHALLFREYSGWVKGRDWYDYLWFLSKETSIDLSHLKKRMCQTNHWAKEKDLNIVDVKLLLRDKIEKLNVKSAQEDVKRFLPDPDEVGHWSQEYFLQTIDLLNS